MMYTSPTPTKKIDTKVLLSTVWIVVMINMLVILWTAWKGTGAEEQPSQKTA
jgi:hypothetical protein